MRSNTNAFLPLPQRIAVFRALHLGDLLCAVPALRALRAAAPRAHITLIGLPWAQSFVQRFHRYIDELMVFSGYPGFPERDASEVQLRAFIEQARAKRFDLAIQLHGTGYGINDILLQLGAADCAGFHPPEHAKPCKAFMPWPEQGHEVRRCTALMRFLGASDCGEHLEFPLQVQDCREAGALLGEWQLQRGRYVCLHAGARLRSRRWPFARFVQVASGLADEGWRIVLTGDASERELCAQLRAALSPRVAAIDAAGRTTLGGLAALVAQARLLVSNDTGLMHVAAAVGTPSVIVSSGGDVERWAPLDRSRHRVLHHDLPCRPCLHETCPIGHPCALAIESRDVLDAARQILNGEPAYA